MAGGFPALQASAESSASMGLGTIASAAEIAARDIDVSPDGRGLPSGSGSVAAGKAVYAKTCANCHGDAGKGASAAALAGGERVSPDALAADRSLVRDIGNYWPYATTLFDYIRRAMPYESPGSLSDNQVYASTAFILYLNGLLDADSTLDARTLPTITMPALQYYRDDNRASGGEL
ncbi:c-type cytochrome [Congregibacter sp.]|uniref:c-type cytochrome n=1 Tax=Congregibacter sp. TaxID=2744308 RepID=UPI003F6CBEAF